VKLLKTINLQKVTLLTLKLCGVAAANTAQKSNAGLSLRAEQINYFLAMNKCYAFSLSLSGTASALGTLAPITQSNHS